MTDDCIYLYVPSAISPMYDYETKHVACYDTWDVRQSSPYDYSNGVMSKIEVKYEDKHNPTRLTSINGIVAESDYMAAVITNAIVSVYTHPESIYWYPGFNRNSDGSWILDIARW